MTTECKKELNLATSTYNLDPTTTTQYESRLATLMASQPKLSEPFPFEKLAAEVLKAKSPLLFGTCVETKRQEIRKYFHETFTLFEKLHDVLLNDDVFYYQPERLRHPLVFYFGHTAVFFLNKLNIAGVIKQRIDPAIESMCAIGVDEMSWDDLNPSHYNWSSISRLREYRLQVRQLVDDLILNLPLTLPINWESPMWIILMGIEHERIHFETSSVLFRQLPPHCVKQTDLLQIFPHQCTPQDRLESNIAASKVADAKLVELKANIINNVDVTAQTTHTLPEMPSLDDVHNVFNAADNGYIKYSEHLREIANDRKVRELVTKSVPSRTVLFGKSYQHHLYGWDNEYGSESHNVEGFDLATKLVTNAQFLGFILNGGYYNKHYWSDEGWKFAQYKTGVLKQAWPHFWQPVAVELEGVEYPTPTQAILETESASKLAAEQAAAAAVVGTKSNNSSDDDGSVVMTDSDNDSECVLVKRKFNSTMRVHPLPYPQKLTITDYKYRWLAGVTDMPWDWPVDLNNLESQAYSRYVQAQLFGQDSLEATVCSKSDDAPKQAVCRLPTEFEYRALQYHILSTYGQATHGGQVQVDTTQNVDLNKFDYALADLNGTVSDQNISLAHASSSPADFYQYHSSGFYDVIGNVWQHCCSVIYPLRDFQVHPAYDDFTVPTFDNMHGLIIGGSWISTGNEACFNARYAFRRHFYQHAGARVGFFTSKPNTGEELQSIEQDTTIANRLHADFYDLLTKADLIKCETPNTKQLLTSRSVNAKLTAKLVSETISKLQQDKALDDFQVQNVMVLGCRGGRLPLELAVLYPEAKLQGIDVTTRLMGAALRMMDGAKVSYLLKTSYQQTNYVCVREDALEQYFVNNGIANPKETIYNRVNLMQTDVCNLPEDKVPYNHYDVVVVDCLDTAYNPKLLLQNIHRHLVTANLCSTKQSIVALNIYHQWEQDNTDSCGTIWGYRDETNGEFVDVERGIANIVPNNWSLVHRSDFNQRVKRVNERIYTLYDMTTYFYAVSPLKK